MIKINLFPEKWKVIPHNPNYGISNQGRVMRVLGGTGAQPGRILKAKKTIHGYLYVDLYKNGNSKSHTISRLVALCFLGPCPTGKEINHKNAIRTDNGSENLEYITHKENTDHAVSLDLYPKGESHHATKLTNEDVFTIIDLRKLGWTLQKIANKFDVHKGTIQKLLSGQRWNHLTKIKESSST